MSAAQLARAWRLVAIFRDVNHESLIPPQACEWRPACMRSLRISTVHAYESARCAWSESRVAHRYSRANKIRESQTCKQTKAHLHA